MPTPDALPFRRYLVRFRTDELPQRFTDTLVLGSGVAGLSAALSAAEHGRVTVVTKGALSDSNTRWAQGGIAAVLQAADSVDSHVEDTLVAGAGLCREEAVRYVIERGGDAVRKLIALGAAFDRDPAGELLFTLEGGHSHHRVIHAQGDSTGLAVQEALNAQAEAHERIRISEQTFAIDLLTDDAGRVTGALVDSRGGGREVIWARAVILATGGTGQVFRETTNPSVATGDGHAMAFRAGAALADMEFVQFHPTTLYVAGASRALVSEAVRGEGAVLRDRHGGAFMEGVHPRKDLAPRDIVSRAILRQMRKTSDTQVYLDATHMGAEAFAKRFPYIDHLCRSFDIDPSEQPIPVRPTAHYMVGGVDVGLDTQTSLPGLLACGECACTGLHGANRLASNSLLEGAVCGARAGEEAAKLLAGTDGPRASPVVAAFEEAHASVALDTRDLTRSLQANMTYHAGVERSGEGLREGLNRIGVWARYALDRELVTPFDWELQNRITVAFLIAREALAREETRGVHCRTDFPEPREAWADRHQVVRFGDVAS